MGDLDKQRHMKVNTDSHEQQSTLEPLHDSSQSKLKHEERQHCSANPDEPQQRPRCTFGAFRRRVTLAVESCATPRCCSRQTPSQTSQRPKGVAQNTGTPPPWHAHRCPPAPPTAASAHQAASVQAKAAKHPDAAAATSHTCLRRVLRGRRYGISLARWH